MATIKNESSHFQLIISLLTNSIFVGFRFDSNFTLFFDRQNDESFEGNTLPWELKLEILEDWWIGDEQKWEALVANNGQGIEPDEPIKAFELAKLRWTEGAIISSVVADNEKLTLVFENETVLHIRLTGEDEFTYLLCENNVEVESLQWSVTLDTEGVHTRNPEHKVVV